MEFGLGIGIKDVGVMIENGGKVGEVKLTWGGFFDHESAVAS